LIPYTFKDKHRYVEDRKDSNKYTKQLKNMNSAGNGAAVVGDATVDGSLGLFASTAGDAVIGESVGGAMLASEMEDALGAVFGASR
jgi:hypothetical protein